MPIALLNGAHFFVPGGWLPLIRIDVDARYPEFRDVSLAEPRLITIAIPFSVTIMTALCTSRVIVYQHKSSYSNTVITIDPNLRASERTVRPCSSVCLPLFDSFTAPPPRFLHFSVPFSSVSIAFNLELPRYRATLRSTRFQEVLEILGESHYESCAELRTFVETFGIRTKIVHLGTLYPFSRTVIDDGIVSEKTSTFEL